VASIGSTGEVRVVVYDSRIDAMSLPGGDIFRYTERKVRQTAIRAKGNVRSRTGRLAGSIRGDVRPLAKGMVVGRVRAGMYYAAWVHEGTTGPIYPESSSYLLVPIRKGSTRKMKRAWVHGQDANPFLEDALRSSVNNTLGRRMFGDSNPFG
jgi:putative component of toxin-antitoxin plasmid stabilization module